MITKLLTKTSMFHLLTCRHIYIYEVKRNIVSNYIQKHWMYSCTTLSSLNVNKKHLTGSQSNLGERWRNTSAFILSLLSWVNLKYGLLIHYLNVRICKIQLLKGGNILKDIVLQMIVYFFTCIFILLLDLLIPLLW